MARFPSEAWAREAVAALNADPDAPAAARGWTGDFGLVVDTEAGAVAVYVGPPSDGRLPAPEVLALESLAARATSYFARADEGTWRELILGTLDPVAAIVQRRIEVRGDLTPVVSRLKYRGLAERWLSGLSQRGL